MIEGPDQGRLGGPRHQQGKIGWIPMWLLGIPILVVLAAGLAGCLGPSSNPVSVGFGAQPVLPEPERALIPTVHIAPAAAWLPGAAPRAAPGFRVTPFAQGLDHPRWLHVLPNGDVLVAETNAPPRPDDAGGLKGWVMKRVMKRAGAAVPSADRITLLRDADGDGKAELQAEFLTGLHSPFGMALVGDQLYVANTDAVLRFSYATGSSRIDAAGVTVATLPAGSINHHWTKNLIATPPERAGAGRLYVTVGSNSNVAENGLENEVDRAAILELDPATGVLRPFATGLRNPNGLAWNPADGRLWTVVNERDEIGNDLVPDYLTAVGDGVFYGWPWSYYGQHVDVRVTPARPDKVASAIPPDYALGAHTASLGLAFYTGALFPDRFRGAAIIGQHGSWNRKPRSGYAVIAVPFVAGRPAGPPEELLGGFVSADGKANGRPVGVAIDNRGALLVADDVGNTVWRVVPAPK